MPTKDFVFLVSFIGNIAGFVLFMVSFANEHWISYGVKDLDGNRGLWKECTFNETDVDVAPICHATTLAEGPAFLDGTRTLMCFALVSYVCAMFCYVFDKGQEDGKTCLSQVKARIQDIAYFIGGFLAGIASIIFGLNYYDYHANELHLKNLELSHAFYIACVTAGLSMTCSVTLSYTRQVDVKKTEPVTAKPAPIKEAANKPQSNDRNKWLKNKDVPTPTNQKKDTEVVVELDKQEVPVKTKNLTRFILPITVIQAARRLQKGISREQEKAETEKGKLYDEKEITMNNNSKQNDKYKGIFTINVDNHAKRSMSPVKETPSVFKNDKKSQSELVRSDTSSFTDTSSSDSSSEDDVNVAGHSVPRAERIKGGAGSIATTSQLKAQQTLKSDSENVKRPRVRRSITTLKKGEEPEWTRHTTLQTPQRPAPPQRTLSHDQYSKHSSIRAQNTIPESNADIYFVPSEPRTEIPSSAINYEVVVTGTNEDNVNNPQPRITHQTQIYKPHS